MDIHLGDEPVTARFFRLGFKGSFQGLPNLISQIAFSNRSANPELLRKAFYERPHNSRIDIPNLMEKARQRKVGADSIVRRDAMVDLTSALQSDGTLTWKVPPGKWTIVRFGHTSTGATNGGPWNGLDVDKFTPEGVKAGWSGMMQPTIERLGPLVGKALARCEFDSWEVGGQNWTAKMAEEFRARRGYDPTPFLPAMTGRTVESPAITERFLWDLRRTVSDLIAENFFRPFAELCRRHGLESMVEPYYGPFESMICGAQVDIPMAEFWQDWDTDSVKMVSSIGHGYGKRIIAAESFTGMPEKHGRWLDDPYSMKAFGDQMFCRGINQFVFHCSVHQPWLNRAPGMTLACYGIHLNRCNTWFEWSGPWMQYLARCQHLLRQGRVVADVAYFCGQNAPVSNRPGNPPTPAGYYWDDINADLLMNHAKVVNGRIVLDSGASYAVLVLPPDDPQMTPELLGKIRDLVKDGATVVGTRPSYSPSLQGYPDCDRQVQALAAELWGDIDGKAVTQHALGKGQVVSGKSLQNVLDGLKVAPDCTTSKDFDYIHLALDSGGDAYFLSNQADRFVQQECSFRVCGKKPELWHPDTGKIEPAPAYAVKGGRVIVPLEFDPSGSVFVVFRQPDTTTDHVVTPKHRLTAVGEPIAVEGSWKLSFPPNWGAPASVTLDRLLSWPEHADSGVKYFSGTATYEKEIQIPAEALVKGGAVVARPGRGQEPGEGEGQRRGPGDPMEAAVPRGHRAGGACREQPAGDPSDEPVAEPPDRRRAVAGGHRLVGRVRQANGPGGGLEQRLAAVAEGGQALADGTADVRHLAALHQGLAAASLRSAWASAACSGGNASNRLESGNSQMREHRLKIFPCYTGGAERDAPYVEPIIRLKYRAVLPEAGFDTSLTVRWAYRPLAVKDL